MISVERMDEYCRDSDDGQPTDNERQTEMRDLLVADETEDHAYRCARRLLNRVKGVLLSAIKRCRSSNPHVWTNDSCEAHGVCGLVQCVFGALCCLP